MNNEIYKKIMNEPFVVVAGAGISMLPPSSLPSWWEFNNILKETIFEKAFSALPELEEEIKNNIINIELPVTALSESIVSMVAGNEYFKLLKLLEGNNPNINHYSLAKLIKNENIISIITTNFDTLIEQAFRNENIQIKVISSESDFSSFDFKNPVLMKIHGSVTNENSFIDTITQKFRGLSKSKKFHISNRISNNPVVFIGFSGSDYIFDDEYIPMNGNKDKPIYWIIRKGSKINERIIDILKKTQRKYYIIEENLPDFFKKLQVDIDFSEVNTLSTPDYSNIKNKVNEFLNLPHITEWGSIAILIDILNKTGHIDISSKLLNLVKEKIDKQKKFELSQSVLLLRLGIDYMHSQDYDKAIYIFTEHIKLIDELNEFFKDSDNLNGVIERKNNKATILNNIGICYLHKNEFNIALEKFNEVISICENTKNKKLLSIALFNKARAEFYFSKNYDIYIHNLKSTYQLAKDNGNINISFDIKTELINIYMGLCEFQNAKKHIDELQKLYEISADIKHKYTALTTEAHFYSLINEPDKSYEKLIEVINLCDNKNILLKNAYIDFIRTLSFYDKYKDELNKKAQLLIEILNSTELNADKVIEKMKKAYTLLLNKIEYYEEEKTIRQNICTSYFHKDYKEIEKFLLLLLYQNLNSIRFLDICYELENIPHISDKAKTILLFHKGSYLYTNNKLIDSLNCYSDILKFNNINPIFEKFSLFRKSLIELILKKKNNYNELINYFNQLLELLTNDTKNDNTNYIKIIINDIYEYNKSNHTTTDIILENIKSQLKNSKYKSISSYVDSLKLQIISRNVQKTISLKEIDKYLKIYKKNKNFNGIFECYQQYIEYYYSQNNLQESINYAKKALNLIKEKNIEKNKISILLKLSTLYFDNKEYDKSIKYAKKIAKEENKINSNEKALSLFYISLSYYLKNDINNFINAIELTKMHFDNIETDDKLINTYKEYTKKLYKTSLEIKKSLIPDKNNKLISEAYRLQSIGKLKESENILKNLLDRKNLTDIEKARIYGIYGYVYLAKGDNKKAKEYFKDAEKIFDKSNQIYQKVEAMRQIAIINRKNKDFVSAIEKFKEILMIVKDKNQKAFTMFDLAQCEYLNYIQNKENNTKKLDKIIKILTKIDKLVNSNELPLANTYLLLAQIYFRIGNIELSKKYLKKSKDIYIFHNSIHLKEAEKFEETINKYKE